ncbi:hypothetical protein GGI21_002321 [Coemansia aciculifera]|nr:hypothetical protein GGI21_002321 [Coemansia aciculifera]
MADRMTGFINEHYPKPTPVNYRAASNFMWVDMDDCMRMHGLLRGRFKWTEAAYARAAELKAQGLSWKKVARHLSPSLRANNLYTAMTKRSMSNPTPKKAHISDADAALMEIARLVDEYTGKYSVVEIANKISDEFDIANRSCCRSKTGVRIAAHPHYRAKLDAIDYDDLVRRIAAGQTTKSLAAEELDIPYYGISERIEHFTNSNYSPEWTGEETSKLIEYARGCSSKPDVAYFSTNIGSKSARQYYDKLCSLKSTGVLHSLDAEMSE